MGDARRGPLTSPAEFARGSRRPSRRDLPMHDPGRDGGRPNRSPGCAAHGQTTILPVRSSAIIHSIERVSSSSRSELRSTLAKDRLGRCLGFLEGGGIIGVAECLQERRHEPVGPPENLGGCGHP
jgi:hypothetical protein